ncbi:MAG: creatininase family protein [Opitutales bacterium]|nr:creatininase family protein [Opitutales bacterium]
MGAFKDAERSKPLFWGRYSELRPEQITSIREQSDIAFVPWGALEWHCQHAPIGLDSIKAEGICQAIAQRIGGVVLPAISMGVNTIKPFKGFPHSIDFSGELVAEVAAAFCSQLADEGFRIVVLLTGHYPPEHLAALEAGACKARKAYPDIDFVVWADNELMGKAYRGDHAGATETSFQLLFDSSNVDLTSLPDRALTLDGDGVMGEDPRDASEERGRNQLAIAVDAAVAQIEAIRSKDKASRK